MRQSWSDHLLFVQIPLVLQASLGRRTRGKIGFFAVWHVGSDDLRAFTLAAWRRLLIPSMRPLVILLWNQRRMPFQCR